MPAAFVSSVASYRVEDATIVLDVRLAVEDTHHKPLYQLPDETASMTIAFHRPDVFRFELAPHPEAEDAVRSVIKEDAWDGEAVSLEVREPDEETLLVQTEALTLEIGRDPWDFAVREPNGETLLEEQGVEPAAKAGPQMHRLGFDLEQTNRWPLRIEKARSSYVLGSDEHIYGLGEKFTEFDKRGQQITSWVTQPNGTESERAYKNVPFFLSTDGYGLLVDTYQRTHFDFGATSTVSTDIQVEDDRFAFVFFGHSSFKGILEAYTDLTGKPGELPKWTFGVWMSRMAYASREEVEAVVEGLRERDFPADVINLDPQWLRDKHLCDLTWDRDAFPDPEGMIEELHDAGFKLCLWEYPYLLTGTEAYAEAREEGYLVANDRGRPYTLRRFSWGDDKGGIVDLTHPDARSWWKDKHEALVEMGVDAFKTDFGEYLPVDSVLADGISGKATRNRFTTLYTRTVHEAMEEAGADPVLWARPGWAGGQQYPIHWAGDPSDTFESMAATLRGGLSLGLSGYGFWGSDIGGYFGDPSPELYVRWAQWALLGMSHARFHGTSPREPWEFGEEAEAIVTRYARERYRLLPYLYSVAEEAWERGVPVMRPLVLEFQEDQRVWGEQTQVMLGEALLVAPVLGSKSHRDVYLPAGTWVEYWSGEVYEGSGTYRLETPLDYLPVFQREGTIVPRRDVCQYVGESDPSEIELLVVFVGEEETLERSIDVGTEEDVNVRVKREGGEVTFDLPDVDVDWSARLRGLEEAPSAIMLGDERIGQVDAEPEPGEWRFDSEDREAIIRFT